VNKEFTDGTRVDPLDTNHYNYNETTRSGAPNTLGNSTIASEDPNMSTNVFTPGWTFAKGEASFDQRTAPVKARNPQRPDTRLVLDNSLSMHGFLATCLEFVMTNEEDPELKELYQTVIKKDEQGTPVFVHITIEDLAKVLSVFLFIHGELREALLHDVTKSAKKSTFSRRTMRDIVKFIYSDKLEKARAVIQEWTVEIPMGAGTFLLHSLPKPITRKSFLVQYLDECSPCKSPIGAEINDIRRCMEKHIQERKFTYYPGIDLSDEDATPRALQPVQPLQTISESSNAAAGPGKTQAPMVLPAIQIEDTSNVIMSVKDGKKPAKFWLNQDLQVENQRESISAISEFNLTLNDAPSEGYPKKRPILPRSESNISQILLPDSYSIIVNPWREAFETKIKYEGEFHKKENNFAGRLYFEKECVENVYVEINELSQGLNRQIKLQKKNIKTTGQIRVLRLDCDGSILDREVPKIVHPIDKRFLRYRFGTFHGDHAVLAIGFLTELHDW